MSEPRILSYTEALREATEQLLKEDPSVVVLGEGVSYKNGADGTTAGLKDLYSDRVLDVPVSENSVTGMAVGAALSGMKPIVHHGRVEFALFAADQIFTQAGKWNYMFGGGNPVSIVFRIAVGRQWGNGPQHTQSLYGLFGSAIGVKVVIPSSPYMAKGLLVAAVRDPNPVIILEPRWLYKLKGPVSEELYAYPLDKAHVVKEGKQLTIVSYGDGLLAAREAVELVQGVVDVELIDLVTINPVDYATVERSLQKTGQLLCVDTTNVEFSVGSDVIAAMAKRGLLPKAPIALSCPSVPCPTSPALTEAYYPTKVDVANAILTMFNKPPLTQTLSFDELHLAPSLTLP